MRHHVEENLEHWREEVAREAERLIPVLQEQRADAELAKAWRLLGFVHGSVCRYGEAARRCSEAAEARAARERPAARGAERVRYTRRRCTGRRRPGRPSSTASISTTQGLSDRQAEALVLCSLAQLRAMQGDFERARELVRAARTVLDDLGVIVLAASTAMHIARHGAARRRPGTAEAELRRADETLTALGERYLLPPLAAVLAQVVYAQGRADEAEEISRRAEELSDAGRRGGPGPLAFGTGEGAGRPGPRRGGRATGPGSGPADPDHRRARECRPMPCSTWPRCCAARAGRTSLARWLPRRRGSMRSRATQPPPPGRRRSRGARA